jgi:predicted RNA-binding Zn-ribbon protein involved in translation (DUF1610 family)
MASHTVQEFIQALDEEIEAIKRGKGGSVVKVFNGRFLRETSGLFVYVFNLENFLAVLDESPAEIEISGKKYSAQVLVTQGLEVEIGIERFCGASIAEARLHTNLWYLLELLKKKFAEYQNGALKVDFHLSDLLFSGGSSEIAPRSDEVPRFSVSTEPPNEAQQRAIASSFVSPLSVIWGPPGTGKTKTIAKAIEAHLNAGRRVLLVSHANNAVDEALEDVAEHLKDTTFYQEGKLVRLGKPQEDHLRKLEENYEMVLPERIALRLAESLVREKAELLDTKTRAETALARLQSASTSIQNVKTFSSELRSLKSAASESTDRLRGTQLELSQFEGVQTRNRSKLVEAARAGTFKRIFAGYNPQKIQREIDQLSVTIDGKGRLVKEIGARLKEYQESQGTKQRDLKEAEVQASVLLRELGISIHDLDIKQKDLLEKKRKTTTRLSEIDQQVDELQKRVLSDAKLVATTLTKTFSSKQFPDVPFDVLVIDEASMAPLPHVYWAAGRCRKFVTIVGDFLQLPPICIANDQPMAHKWLGRSIFTVLGINNVSKATSDPRVSLLDTQYRMVPPIAHISNTLFYNDRLKDHPSTHKHKFDDGVSQSSLVLVETGSVNAWCSRLSTGGRFNLYNALVCATLARRILQNVKEGRIGIITPYSAQARLINKIAKDWGLLDRLRISTVHRFQGGEEPIIIFDSVEGPGTKLAPMLDDTRLDSDARLLLNVAMTRAKSRLYFVGNTSHLLSELHRDAALTKIIEHLSQHAQILESESFVDSYFTSDFEKWADILLTTTATQHEPISGELYTERNFWAQFLRDIKTVENSLIILSPFLSVRRSGILMNYFQAMVLRGIELRVYTRPVSEQTGEMANQAEVVIEQLRSIGATVTERTKMHQKIAVIDNALAWEGSLNILSHRDSGEQMRRFEGKSAIEEIIKNLELERTDAVGNVTGDACPKCGKPMVVRKSKYGAFSSCSTYPRCDGKIDHGRKRGSGQQRTCPDCGKRMVLRRSARGSFLGCSGYPACKKTMRL